MKRFMPIILGLMIIVVLAAGTVFVLAKNKEDNKLVGRQAVFLTNGQVYFGFVENPRSQIVKIKEIYYLKTSDLTQDNTTEDSNKKISLIKLGNELHGPTDEMLISQNQILFIESMRDDSKINDAIKRFSAPEQSKK